MKNNKKTTAKEAFEQEVCNFVFNYSNACWNLAKEGKHKEAQQLGVEMLMGNMPKLCREFLNALAVSPDSPFAMSVDVLDEGFAASEDQKADAAT